MQAKPFLRWAGSKRRLVPYLSSFWGASYNRYIEPFMGSAVLYYSLNPEKAILSDLNEDLVNTFLSIKASPEKVYEKLVSLEPKKENYYLIRALDPNNLPSEERAARFIFLNRFCFNGLYRTNQKGDFNVPFSPSGTGNIPSLEALKLAAQRLENTEVYARDFEPILKDNVIKGDFIYLDPPYATNSKRVFNEYGPGSFCVDDIRRLKEVLNMIHEREAHFVLSYGYCPEAIDAFSRWTNEKMHVQRNISGFVKGRRTSEELIVTNII
jgi:DNA adenine methylase